MQDFSQTPFLLAVKFLKVSSFHNSWITQSLYLLCANLYTMKIHFKRGRINFNLILGLSFFLFGLYVTYTSDSPSWSDFGYFVFAIVYFLIFIYQLQYQYVIINDHFIQKSTPFSRRISLKEIEFVKNERGEIVIGNQHTQIRINTQLIDELSLLQLKVFLKDFCDRNGIQNLIPK